MRETGGFSHQHATIFPIAWSDKLPDFFPNLTLRTVPDCGHWVQREQPELVNQAIAEFIAP